MLNEAEWLLATLAEEAGEVVQAAMKCERFGIGPGDTYPDGTPNLVKLEQEFHDLVAVMIMLDERDLFPSRYKRIGPAINAKTAKVQAMMKLARERGQLAPVVLPRCVYCGQELGEGEGVAEGWQDALAQEKFQVLRCKKRRPCNARRRANK